MGEEKGVNPRREEKEGVTLRKKKNLVEIRLERQGKKEKERAERDNRFRKKVASQYDRWKCGGVNEKRRQRGMDDHNERRGRDTIS